MNLDFVYIKTKINLLNAVLTLLVLTLGRFCKRSSDDLEEQYGKMIEEQLNRKVVYYVT